jgi:hypothetical protein
MSDITRRGFLNAAAALGPVGLSCLTNGVAGFAMPAAPLQVSGERSKQDSTVKVVNPRNRVPVSMIIDDSTCLVNLAYFAMPQFSETWPQREDYRKPWTTWPREIPDSFVRRFGEWCAERGVKGKYSIVPQPACVGWVDREMPGWSHRQLEDSLQLVRELMLPSWDIHPEMATHTRVIDTRTGRPFPDRGPQWMENWQWTDGKSVDQLADYLTYSLQILKNAGLPCDGITTPGGFAGKVVPELAQATLQSVRHVFGSEIPHYFKFLYTDERSVIPQVEYAKGLDGNNPECVVSVVGCTGDWFGGWDGTEPGSPDQFITADLQSGRMVDVIEKQEPAIMVCHWPGMYYNGTEHGFNVFKTVVDRLHQRFDNLNWMKLSEIARYWAAKELTTITRDANKVTFIAPFASPDFTVLLPITRVTSIRLGHKDSEIPLTIVTERNKLTAGTYLKSDEGWLVCFNLPKGQSVLRLE